ncbi:MAG: filamentous hemagglutinin N-terminal domain-containing protein, partial [Verrucomicrobiota bacterium]
MTKSTLLWLLPCGFFVFGAATAEAGDLLRGGRTSGETVFGDQFSGSHNPFGPNIPSIQRANDSLARMTQVLQSIRSAQNAARAVAQGAANAGADPNHPGQSLPNVANGLAAGGLVPDSGLASPGIANPTTSWQNAAAPVQTVENGKTTVTIQQTGEDAVLNWQTFNIGKGTTLDINQGAGNWIAFNEITDPGGVPSQILGSIKAQGQVYVIDQNGIIFGGGSQVNVHTLVASSLPINYNLVNGGLLNNPDAQFLFSALPQNAGSNGTPSFTPPASTTPDGEIGNVVVQSGAIIAASPSADGAGGSVALIGANVTNQGSLLTPDGQTILAAGLQVGLAAHSSSDPSLRGLDVYVGAVSNPASSAAPYAGTATNSGSIDAPYGDITIAGKTIDQLGALNSMTSVSLNGRIDLLANYNAYSNPGYDPVNDPGDERGRQCLSRRMEYYPGSRTSKNHLCLFRRSNISRLRRGDL